MSNLTALHMRMKRPGKRFVNTSLGLHRIGINHDVKTAMQDGESDLVPTWSRDIAVNPTMPGVSFMSIGIATAITISSF